MLVVEMLADGGFIFEEVQEIAQKYKHRCNSDNMEATAKWRKS